MSRGLVVGYKGLRWVEVNICLGVIFDVYFYSIFKVSVGKFEVFFKVFFIEKRKYNINV